MRRLHVFGDSHVNGLYAGWERIAAKTAPLPFSLRFYAANGANWFEFETDDSEGKLLIRSDRLEEIAPGSAMEYLIADPDDIYVFSSPLHSCTVYRNASWRSFCPWECADANPDLQAVSTAAIEAWAEAQLACRLALLETAKTRVFSLAVVEPPKPLPRVLALYSLRRDVLATVDRIYRDFVVRRLGESGIPVISVPEHMVSDGFTRDEFAARDPTDPHHGNEQFGAEMMMKILEFGQEALRRGGGPAATAPIGGSS
jgi:hypothetical protein